MPHPRPALALTTTFTSWGSFTSWGTLTSTASLAFAAALALLSLATGAAAQVAVSADDTLFTVDAARGEGGLGAMLAPAGDLDGDGVPDLLVGLPQLSGAPASGAGKLRAVSGADGTTLFDALGRVEGEAFGSAACRVGDVDGDGVDDLAVGVPRDDGLAVNGGAVRLHSGRDGRALMHPLGRSAPGQPSPKPQPRELAGAEPFGWLGSALAPLGDLDGDGVADLAAAAPSDATLSFDPGYVLVVSALSLSPLLEIWGESRHERFGAALAAVPDLDDDGLPDLAIGAPTAELDGRTAGRVLIVSTGSARTLMVLEGQPGERFGSALAALPDLDGDGVAELLVGAPGTSAGGVDAGAAHVVSLKTGARLVSHAGQEPRARLGSSVASLGDLDGDGAPDLALGAPDSQAGGFGAGAVVVLRATDGQVLLRIDGDNPGLRLGRSLLGPGDLDGDGRSDLWAGVLALPDRAAPPGAVRAYAGREVLLKEEEKGRKQSGR